MVQARPSRITRTERCAAFLVHRAGVRTSRVLLAGFARQPAQPPHCYQSDVSHTQILSSLMLESLFHWLLTGNERTPPSWPPPASLPHGPAPGLQASAQPSPLPASLPPPLPPSANSCSSILQLLPVASQTLLCPLLHDSLFLCHLCFLFSVPSYYNTHYIVCWLPVCVSLPGDLLMGRGPILCVFCPPSHGAWHRETSQ